MRDAGIERSFIKMQYENEEWCMFLRSLSSDVNDFEGDLWWELCADDVEDDFNQIIFTLSPLDDFETTNLPDKECECT